MITTAALCLALNVYHESRGESIEGQRAVAAVTMNRANWDQDKVCDVVFARKQFSWTNGLTLANVDQFMPKDEKAWKIAKRVAVNVKKDRVRSRVGHATHFHTPAVNPRWNRRMIVVARIGGHIFYAES